MRVCVSGRASPSAVRAGGRRVRVSGVCVCVCNCSTLRLAPAFALAARFPRFSCCRRRRCRAAAAAAPAAPGGHRLRRSRRRRRGRRRGRAAAAAAPPPRLAWAACFVSEIDKDAGNQLLNNVSGNFHVIPPTPTLRSLPPGRHWPQSSPVLGVLALIISVFSSLYFVSFRLLIYWILWRRRRGVRGGIRGFLLSLTPLLPGLARSGSAASGPRTGPPSTPSSPASPPPSSCFKRCS